MATEEELAAGRGYEGLFVPALFAAWSPHLVAGAGLAPGQHVLDVACGTGVLARAARTAVGPGGRVVGLDPAPGMLAVAAEVAPALEWVPGDAQDLPFPDRAFDAVVSQFGLMFVPDKARALAEMRRVLKPGGRVALAVWDAVSENPAYREVAALFDAEIGPEAGEAVRVPFSMGDRAAFLHLVEAAGFVDAEVETRREEARFPSPRTIAEVEMRGWLPLFGITLDEARIAEILAVAETRLAGLADGSGAAVFPTSAHVLTAAAPG